MKKRLFLAAIAGAGLSASPILGAQPAGSYPTRPVKIVVPFPPGSGPDQLARILSQQLQATLHQPFVVDNKVGALGAIGAGEVSRAAPDGYTLLLATNTTHAANVSLFKTLAYDPVKNFTAITRVATGQLMLLVRPDSPHANLASLIKAGQGAGKLTAGYGAASPQVAAAKLRQDAKLNLTSVPYKGIPEAVNDMLGGHVDFTFADLPVALPLVRGGRARPLGVTSVARYAGEPQIPAIAETLPGYEVLGWLGVVAPAGTPDAIIQRLDGALSQALKQPELSDRIRGMFYLVEPMSTRQFGDYIGEEIVRWKEYARVAGIEPQ